MEINLEKIDLIRERAGVSYKKAKETLEMNGGDVVEALIFLEEESKSGSSSTWTKNMGAAGNDMIEKLKRVIERGNVTRVLVKKDNETLLNIPVTAGAIGVVLAPLVSLLGISAAIATKMKIEIVKNDGKTYDLNEIAEEKVGEFKSKMKKNQDDSMFDENIDDTIDDIDSGADF
ncbi:MAG: DUF4342 domain-containing protein [Clostridiaceae bacterium]|nr:DUF4342 domain-containing protein [Clostridiaceae bacterium]